MGADRLNARVADYRVAEFLGRGGMGEVYRAVHGLTGQVVAIKFLPAHCLNPNDLARFYHEARVQAALDHPNIARLYELVNVEGQPCLVMEHVDGESLADRIGRSGRLLPREALRILRDVAAAVASIHAVGVVHRDLKPANIRLTRQGQVKLLDFGIATSGYLSGLTRLGNVIGTTHYLSPEQLAGRPATAGSDLWALGVLLYEMTTGRLPFDGATTAEMKAQIEAGRYVRPSRLSGAAPPMLTRGLDKLVEACLTPAPSRRLASAAVLAERAAACLDHPSTESAAAGRMRLAVAAWCRRTHGAVRPDTSPNAARVWSREVIDGFARAWRGWAAGAAAVVLGVFVLVVSGGTNDALDPTVASAAGTRRVSMSTSRPQVQAIEHIDVTNGPAEVWVDNRSYGITPIDYLGLLGQTISVEVRKPGYHIRHEEITLSPNHTSTLELKPAGTP